MNSSCPDKINWRPFTHSLTSLHLLAADWPEQERPSKLVTTAQIELNMKIYKTAGLPVYVTTSHDF